MSNSSSPPCPIFKLANIAPVERGGGARTFPMASRNSGSNSIMTGITVIDPGAAIPLHLHNCDESVIVLEGNAFAEVDGVRIPVGTLDSTFIPASVPHRFLNASTTRRLSIFWTYASADATRTLLETGHTQRVDFEHSRLSKS